jgi:hypothetical protein
MADSELRNQGSWTVKMCIPETNEKPRTAIAQLEREVRIGPAIPADLKDLIAVQILCEGSETRAQRGQPAGLET